MRPVSRPSPLVPVQVRLTSVEAQQLTALADLYSVSLSEMARRVTLWGYTLYPRYPAQGGAVIVPDEYGLCLHIKARGREQAALIHDLLFAFDRGSMTDNKSQNLSKLYDQAVLYAAELHGRITRLDAENEALRAELAAPKAGSK